MSMTNPASVSSDGTRRIVWLPVADAPADPTAISTIELADGLDVSLYLVHGADGFNGTVPQDPIPDNRQGTSQSFTRPGRKNPTLSIRYVFNDAVPAENEAKLQLVEGAKGAFVQLFQVAEDYDADTDGGYDGFSYRYWPVQLGAQDELPEEVNAVDRINQGTFITGQVVRGVVGGGS